MTPATCTFYLCTTPCEPSDKHTMCSLHADMFDQDYSTEPPLVQLRNAMDAIQKYSSLSDAAFHAGNEAYIRIVRRPSGYVCTTDERRAKAVQSVDEIIVHPWQIAYLIRKVLVWVEKVNDGQIRRIISYVRELSSIADAAAKEASDLVEIRDVQYDQFFERRPKHDCAIRLDDLYDGAKLRQLIKEVEHGVDDVVRRLNRG